MNQISKGTEERGRMVMVFKQVCHSRTRTRDQE